MSEKNSTKLKIYVDGKDIKEIEVGSINVDESLFTKSTMDEQTLRQFSIDGSSLIDPLQPKYSEDDLIKAVINGMRQFGIFLGEETVLADRGSFDVDWWLDRFFDQTEEE